MFLLTRTLPSDALVLLSEATLKGTLILVLALGLTLALANARAAVRHLIWSLALIGMIAVPVLSFVIPHWTLPLLPSPVAAAAPSAQSQGRPVASAGVEVPQTPSLQLPINQPREATVAAAASEVASISLSSVVAGLWIGGLIACLLVALFGVVSLRVLARSAKRIDDPEWATLLASLKHELALDRDVVLLRSPRASMPATWGVARAVILLPAESDGWTEDRRKVVLLHELAHIKRYDCLTQLAAQICCALYWFHPGVWYVARRMRTERELACDEQVLTLGVNACDYADHLLDIARGFRAPVGARIAAVAMARPSQLEGRLLAILNGDVASRNPGSTLSRRVAIALLLVVIFPLAAMRPWREIGPTSVPAQIVAPLPLPESPAGTPIIAADTLRWSARAVQGQWVSIHTTLGEIRAVPADGSEVDVVAVKKAPGVPDPQLRIHVDTRRTGFDVCVVPVGATIRNCEDPVRRSVSDGQPRIDFIVRVPAGVGFAGHTGIGNVTADNLRSYAWGTALRGDINIRTSDLAEASTNSGSITAVFGRATWKGDLEFETRSGNVTVVAPGNSSAMVQVETNLGTIQSDFPLSRNTAYEGDYRQGRIGAGRAMLTLRTRTGNIELRRGADGTVAPVADVETSAIYPEPAQSGNTEAPAPPGDSEPGGSSAVTSDDPTGERLPFAPPADLADRVSDARIASAVDRVAIIRLREVARRHRKKHPADLVKERSEWALSLVRDGRLIQPLIGALANDDWRVRAYAAWALTATGEASALSALTAAMNDSNYRVRMHAVYGLERGGAGALPALIRALGDSHWQVRVGAVGGLVAIDDARAVEPLRAIRQDQHPLVREEVAQALGRLER